MVAPPLDDQRPTRGIRACARAQSAQARPLAPALAARATCSCTPACHSSSSRLGSGQFCVQPCRALRKRCESTRPEHWDRLTTGSPRQRTLLGTRLHSGARTCSPPLAAASRTELPDAPERRRARAPPRLVLAGRALVGGPPCRAGGLRWRTTRVAARPPTLGWGPCYRRAATLAATHPSPSRTSNRRAARTADGPPCSSARSRRPRNNRHRLVGRTATNNLGMMRLTRCRSAVGER